MLNTTMNIKDGELFVTLDGRLDALSSQDFEKELEEHYEGVSAITMDCAKLEYISSAGLRTILAAEQYLENQGNDDVKVINANEAILDILEETGFLHLINVVQ